MAKDDGIHPVQCCQYHQDAFDALPKTGAHKYNDCMTGFFPRAETRTAHEIAIDDVKWAVGIFNRLLYPFHKDDPVEAPKSAGKYMDTMRARYKGIGWCNRPEAKNPPKVSTGQEVMTVVNNALLIPKSLIKASAMDFPGPQARRIVGDPESGVFRDDLSTWGVTADENLPEPPEPTDAQLQEVAEAIAKCEGMTWATLEDRQCARKIWPIIASQLRGGK